MTNQLKFLLHQNWMSLSQADVTLSTTSSRRPHRGHYRSRSWCFPHDRPIGHGSWQFIKEEISRQEKRPDRGPPLGRQWQSVRVPSADEVRGASNDGDDDAGVTGPIFHSITEAKYASPFEIIYSIVIEICQTHQRSTYSAFPHTFLVGRLG